MAKNYHPSPIIDIVSSLIGGLVLSVVVFFLRQYISTYFSLALGAIWGIMILKIIWSIISVRFQTIVLAKRGVEYVQGVISQHRVILPYDQITEAKYTQSIMERIFNIGSLYLDTAGGSKMAIHVHNLSMDVIHEILDNLHNVPKGM